MLFIDSIKIQKKIFLICTINMFYICSIYLIKNLFLYYFEIKITTIILMLNYPIRCTDFSVIFNGLH